MADGTAESDLMELNDLTYFRRRAEHERQLAFGAKNQELAAIHEKLARQYESLIAQLERRFPSDPARSKSSSEDRLIWHTDWNS
jgi:hypothetical protein